jgi:hypothetical protein
MSFQRVEEQRNLLHFNIEVHEAHDVELQEISLIQSRKPPLTSEQWFQILSAFVVFLNTWLVHSLISLLEF